jgi:hypothetical protein
MRTKQEVLDFMETQRIIPNVLNIFLAEFEFEEAEKYLQKDVTEEVYNNAVRKTKEEQERFLNTLKNSISALFINIINNMILPQAKILEFIDQVLFLKQFLWFDKKDHLTKELSFEYITTKVIIDLSKKIKEEDDDIYNFVEFDKYMIDVEKIITMKYKLTYKKDGKVLEEKLLSYVPEGFQEKMGKKEKYWKKIIGKKEYMIVKAIKKDDKKKDDIKN